MVAICVRTLGAAPVTCNARPLLFKAYASLERGEFIAAGCQLREAIRLWLHAECQYFYCLPPSSKRPELPPIVLAKALKKSGEMGPDHFEWVKEAIEIANKSAHLVFVRPSLVTCCIEMMHAFIDGSDYLIEPVAAGRLS